MPPNSLNKPAKGLLLVAEPSIIGDLSFNRSAILLAEHNDEGSIGFILNKPLKYDLNDLVPEVQPAIPVFNGGPVEQDNLYFIHNAPEIIENSVAIDFGIYWGGDFAQIVELLNSGLLCTDQIQFFLGYSGWGPEQLEQEWSENNWLVMPNDLHREHIFKTDQNYWRKTMNNLGGAYAVWANAPENPTLN
ncbi:MAG: YqgE/AlgH family protein [Flavobacteriaceae bacterium]